jgi:glycosyltransferase involved in cell wall biosynthesis
MTDRRYCLISPCRDEAAYARYTLDSVIAQTIPPSLWIIVDDGCTDQTPQILRDYAQRFPYIRIIHRENRGCRKLGAGVIDAFYDAYHTINPSEFPYLCKLDMDLVLPPRYFELLMQRMEQTPRLGTISGKPYFPRHPFSPLPLGDGPGEGAQLTRLVPPHFISEKCGDENSVGMTKFYRTACFQQIGGFVRALMWDGIDCHRCRMLGWLAQSHDDPELRFLHLRPMGSSDRNSWIGRVRHGQGQYFMGTSPFYMLASALFRMTRPPLILGGLAMLTGYFQALLQRHPRYDDKDFRRFLRRYQWNCLMRGKRAATAALNARQSTIWNPAAPKM